jgi:uncharacterized membrane protein
VTVNLDLTDREEKALKAVVFGEPTNRLFRIYQRPLKGFTGFLAGLALVVVPLAFIAAIMYGYAWIDERFGGTSTVLMLVFGMEAIILKLQLLVRNRLLRKLYRALEEGEEGRALNRPEA